MKLPLFLLLLLLGTVAAFHLRNSAPYLDSQQSQADLGQDLEGSKEQEGESVLTEEAIQSEGEQVQVSSYQDAFEDDKKAMESHPGALEKNLQCPRAEDTVEISGSPGCKTCRYVLVQTLLTFADAQATCRRCYRGNLVSVHNLSINYQIQALARLLQIWIGGAIGGWCSGFHWIDGSSVNFNYWAHHHGQGHCVSLWRGGHWQQSSCATHLPFICSY